MWRRVGKHQRCASSNVGEHLSAAPRRHTEYACYFGAWRTERVVVIMTKSTPNAQFPRSFSMRRCSSLLLLWLAAAGCSSKPSTGTGPAPSSGSGSGSAVSAEGKRVRVAFVSNNSFEFWKIARKGTEKAAKELDVDVE